jgi:quercetin dioxygenase-like cupin family protein
MGMELDVGQAVVLEPGPGRKLERPELLVSELDRIPKAGVAPHVHREHADAFYVLEGEVEFLLGDEMVRAGPGTFVAAPPGIAHTFGNPGPDGARLLNMHSPDGGFLDFLRQN